MRSEGFRDVMLVVFTVTVIAVFVYALVVEPILDYRRESQARLEAEQAKEPESGDPPAPPPSAF